MAKITRGKNLKDFNSQQSSADVGKLRIIGGTFRGRQIEYSGDPVTRPMKDLTREACFNLVGGYVEGKAAFDLFAGTGAIGLEALSRGATQAFLVERHIPTLRIVESNVQSLGLESKAKVINSDTFFWVRQFLNDRDSWPAEPWVVFCCPPYALFEDNRDELLITMHSLIDVAPEDSVFVVESDHRFQTSDLPDEVQWQTRYYPPAYISVAHKRG
ncbi:RsmD family RNA methyltransferase [Mariniblastus fucicola]|uniref:Ribosomal RNA small subunit methyltransferase D n=1 Tax=Mariniblastus fucicola TaxID=980251 RepID=A0A5B9P5V8_9BACT|nr:RsmD family RNA methyltransferase [Mariniblastus fucicola]QEG20565.1 Ribosomal RNA small subunit methyltransferase D [Mariniblastus fucicola]